MGAKQSRAVELPGAIPTGDSVRRDGSRGKGGPARASTIRRGGLKPPEDSAISWHAKSTELRCALSGVVGHRITRFGCVVRAVLLPIVRQCPTHSIQFYSTFIVKADTDDFGGSDWKSFREKKVLKV